MQNMPPSMMQSFILFLIIGTGFGAGKAGVIQGATVRALSRFLVDFTLPALIIISMQRPYTAVLRDQSLRVLLISSIIYAASFPLAYATTKLYREAGKPELGVHRFAMCFSNVGFMGFPVAESLLGRESLFIVSIYNIPFQILAFSVGVVMLAGKSRKPSSGLSGYFASLKVLFNPAIASALMGFMLFLGSVHIPDPLYTAMDLLGGMTTPLAMVVIGVVLSQTKLSNVFGNPRLWMTTGYRLAFHPLLIYLFARTIGLSGLELYVPVLVSAMPVAANSTILAGVYGGDRVTASALVFVSTILSLVTIPVIGWLFL